MEQIRSHPGRSTMASWLVKLLTAWATVLCLHARWVVFRHSGFARCSNLDVWIWIWILSKETLINLESGKLNRRVSCDLFALECTMLPLSQRSPKLQNEFCCFHGKVLHNRAFGAMMSYFKTQQFPNKGHLSSQPSPSLFVKSSCNKAFSLKTTKVHKIEAANSLKTCKLRLQEHRRKI